MPAATLFVKLSFLLDSSACVAVLRRKVVLEKLPPPERTGIPVIVAAELWTGVEKSAVDPVQKAALLNGFLSLFELVDFTPEAARHYGNIRATLERSGNSIDPLDLLIAAQARSLSLTLVTSNESEFSRVPGLKVLGIS